MRVWALLLASVIASFTLAAQPHAKPHTPPKARTLSNEIEEVIASSPGARAAFWGIDVADVANGKTLAEVNANRFFVPASNTKLFTTALALTRLGAEYRFQTRVVSSAPPDPSGSIAGDVRLTGGGDPNLSGRAVPYSRDAPAGDPLAAIAELADQVAAHGVTRIEGNIVGDDTWFVWQPFGSGWSIDDPLYEYGAPVSALTVNDNTLWVYVRPGAEIGDTAVLALNPSLEYYQIDNRIRTVAAGAERRIHYARAPGSLTLSLWGTIPVGGSQDLQLAVEDPAQFAALALRQALEDRGITVTGRALARHISPNEIPDLKRAASAEPDPFTELAVKTSAPFLEDLRITDKVSQNLHAEMALRDVGRARRNMGSVEAGLEEMKAFLTEAGISGEGYNLNDGSGLARGNLVTPATVVKLLRHMYQSPAHDNWISLLPVGGEDGTLSKRFLDAAVAGKIHAKTGSLSHVSALSGYAQRANGRWVAFSILVNNYAAPTADVRTIMDRICTLILK